ncbi:MAG: hypothetical protein IT292_10020 [Deltaproteobacteria bacterium]|nr:hypothetical protein [Deltaproteobacteria bacterium]
MVIASAGVVFFVLFTLSDYLYSLGDQKVEIAKRRDELKQISRLLQVYQARQTRHKMVLDMLAQSQISAEQAYSNLDNIVKKIGSEKYDLKPKGEAKRRGADYEAKDYTLKISSLKREQLVNLLFEIEQSKGLFLKKVDILSRAGGNFEATLEIYSITKS